MKFALTLIAAVALCSPCFAFGGRSVIISRQVIRQPVVRQRVVVQQQIVAQPIVVAQPFVQQVVTPVYGQQFVAPQAVQAVGAASFFCR